MSTPGPRHFGMLPTGLSIASSMPSRPEGILWSLELPQPQGSVGKKRQRLLPPKDNPENALQTQGSLFTNSPAVPLAGWMIPKHMLSAGSQHRPAEFAPAAHCRKQFDDMPFLRQPSLLPSHPLLVFPGITSQGNYMMRH